MQYDTFEWHDRKAASNVRDHGVSFEQATFVFDDLYAIDEIDTITDYGEERSIILGRALNELLVVVYTMRGEFVRIISARKAEKHERQRYNRQNR